MIGQISINPKQKINGLIEEYKIAKDGNISAGDFVEFISGDPIEQNVSSIEKSGLANAVMLNDDYIFVAYNSTANYKLAACILKIEKDNIIIVTPETIIDNSINMYGFKPDMVVLEDNKVMIAYCGDSSYYLYSVICTIDENYTITAGTSVKLHNSSYTGYNIHLLKINSTKVFITYSYSSSYYIYGLLCTIDGMTITAGSYQSIYSSSYCGQAISPVLLSDGRVFIASSGSSSNYYLYASICSLNLENNSFTVSLGGTSLVSTSYTGKYVAAIALEDNKVCIISPSDNSNYYLMSRVYKVNGTTVSFLNSSYLNKTSSSGYRIQAVKQDNDTIKILHTNPGGTSSGLMITTCGINGDNIGVIKSKTITSDNISGANISSIISTKKDVIALYAKDSTYKLYTTLINSLIKKSEKRIHGVAKENGLSNVYIKIYTPKGGK